MLTTVKPTPLRTRMWTSFNNVTPAFMRLPPCYDEHYAMIPVNVTDYDRALAENEWCRQIELPPHHLIPNAVAQQDCVIEPQKLIKWEDYSNKIPLQLSEGHLYWIIPEMNISKAIIGRFDRKNDDHKFEFVLTDDFSKKGRVGEVLFF